MPPRADPGQRSEPLRQALANDPGLDARSILSATQSVSLAAVAHGSASVLGGQRAFLRGARVLLATRDQLPAALALIELDGWARSIVLCPPDILPAAVPDIAALAEVDAVVWDGAFDGVADLAVAHRVLAALPMRPIEAGAQDSGDDAFATEWVLLTSGTTGEPKLVAYTQAILAAAITPGVDAGDRPVWSTFYDIRRYGGLQILLRALLTGGSLVLSSADEPVAAFLARAGRCGVTHMSGTPSHWRRAVMSPAVRQMAPRTVRLSGEIADQAILDALRRAYPAASIAHAFASTEAGVAFDVGDGLAGFPARLIGNAGAVEMAVVDGTLRIRSARTGQRYLGGASGPLKDADGFVDTGDIVERTGDRYLFAGRRGGVINVGGAKVYPEEVEAVLNRHPAVQVARVMGRKSAFTGAIVVAEVVALANAGPAGPELEAALLEACRTVLPAHKVPAMIRFVATLDVAPSGKLRRV